MKQHPRYPHLQITEDGKVFSTKTNKFLKFFLHKNGYYVFSTALNGRKGGYSCFKVHRLVAETYIDNPNNYPFVNHLDGNKTNNSIDNLEWCTAKQNSEHAKALGLLPKLLGPKNGAYRTNDELITKAKELYKQGKSLRHIGREFGFSHGAIKNWIVNY